MANSGERDGQVGDEGPRRRRARWGSAGCGGHGLIHNAGDYDPDTKPALTSALVPPRAPRVVDPGAGAWGRGLTCGAVPRPIAPWPASSAEWACCWSRSLCRWRCGWVLRARGCGVISGVICGGSCVGPGRGGRGVGARGVVPRCGRLGRWVEASDDDYECACRGLARWGLREDGAGTTVRGVLWPHALGPRSCRILREKLHTRCGLTLGPRS